jgi:uncharacterized protein
MSSFLFFKSKSYKPYVYDSVSNKIIQIPRSVDLLTNEDLKEQKVKDYLSGSSDCTIELFGPIKGWIQKETLITKSIIFNVTDACNLRCSYCAYSDYYPFERSHGNSIMSFDTACSIIDKFTDDKSHISFYGGEPLLARNLIRKIVSYAKDKGKNSYFSINTNATLLSEGWIRFLVENNIRIQVSIDGMKEQHDKFRKDYRGRDTYDKVLSSLEDLYSYNRDYYLSNVTFIATLTPPYNLNSVIDCFKSSHLFNYQPWFVNYVNPMNTTFIDAMGGEGNYKEYDKQVLMVADEYIQCAIAGNIENHFGNWLFGSALKKLHYRVMNPDNRVWINGSCTPILDKLFITTQGEFFPCERSGGFMSLGNINDGVSSLIADEIVDKYTSDANLYCSKCPNVRFCDTCYLATRSGNEQDVSLKYKYCGRRIEKTKLALYIYTSVLEKNPVGFDRLWTLMSES